MLCLVFLNLFDFKPIIVWLLVFRNKKQFLFLFFQKRKEKRIDYFSNKFLLGKRKADLQLIDL